MTTEVPVTFVDLGKGPNPNPNPNPAWKAVLNIDHSTKKLC